MSGRPTYEELEKRVKELEKYEFEWNQADQTHRESEEQYKNFSDVTFEAIFLSELGLCIGQNKNAERMFGYNFKEALGRPATDWIHPEYHSIVKQHILSGDENPYEAVAIRKNGSTFPCEIQGLMTVQKGKPIRVTALRDIIERKNAGKVIAEKERFLNSLINAMPIPVFYKDREGIYQGFNAAYEAFIGKSRDQLIGKSVFDISPKELAQIYYDKDTELFDSGGIQHYESHVKNAKGEMRDVVFDKSVYTDSNGKIIGLIGTVSDITEPKRMEKTLKQSEERFRKMADLLPGAIVETDADLRITYVNQQGLKLFNYSEEDIAAGLNGLDLIHPDDREKALKRVADRLAKKTITATEYRVLKKDKESFWVFFNASPIYKTDQIIGFRLVLNDITDRKQIEKEREKLIDELQNVLAEIKTLKGIVPICSNCKKIRDDAGYWNILESYIQKHSDASFSHSICPECSDKLYGNEDWYIEIKEDDEKK